MPMWVVLKNVPPSMFTWPGLSFLASPVGYPKRLHQETELVTCFDEAKVFVEVDLTQELPKSYYFQVKGEETCVQFEYPWLPPRCRTCRCCGHLEDGCVVNAGRKSSSPMKMSKPVDKQTSPIIQKALTDILPAPAPSVEVAEPAKVVSSDLAPAVEVVSANPVETSALHLSEEVEEGEFTPSSPGPVTISEDGEWSKVTHSGSKRSNSKNASTSNLKYGEVRILSSTQFDVLHEPDDMDPDDSVSESVIGVTQDEARENTTSQQSGSEGTATRTILPKNSKSGHRFLADPSKRERSMAAAPATAKVNKRTSKQKR